MSNQENYDYKETDKEILEIKIDKSIFTFIIKAVVVGLIFLFVIKYLFGNIKFPEIPKIPETEKNKLILLSFVQNPYVLLRLSQIEIENKNYTKAQIYLESAIGLMEMHGASDKALLKYENELKNLKSIFIKK